MNFALKTWIIASAFVVTGISWVGEAQAQNTYADVPFNQGSLFYRPSGARPPRMTTPNANPNPRASRRRLFRPLRPYYAPPRAVTAPRYLNTTPTITAPAYSTPATVPARR